MSGTVEFAEQSCLFFGFASNLATRCFQLSKCCPELGDSSFKQIALLITRTKNRMFGCRRPLLLCLCKKSTLLLMVQSLRSQWNTRFCLTECVNPMSEPTGPLYLLPPWYTSVGFSLPSGAQNSRRTSRSSGDRWRCQQAWNSLLPFSSSNNLSAFVCSVWPGGQIKNIALPQGQIAFLMLCSQLA